MGTGNMNVQHTPVIFKTKICRFAQQTLYVLRRVHDKTGVKLGISNVIFQGMK